MSTHIDEETRAWDKAAEIIEHDDITRYSTILALLGIEGVASLERIGAELGLQYAWILYRDELIEELQGETLKEVIHQPEDKPLQYELTAFGRAVLHKLATLTDSKNDAARD